MATLIDWSTVRTKVESYRELFDYENSSLALSHVLLETLFALSPEEISESIPDGPNDRGVDAVVLQELNEGDIVHLFQVKHVTEFNKATNNFPSSEIDKLLSFISDLLQKHPNLEKTCNPLLWGKVQEIWEAFEHGTPSFVVHLAGNLGPLISTERERLQQSLKQYRSFSVKEHTLESLAGLLLDFKVPKIDRQIRLVDNQYFERVDGNIRGLIATVQAADLVELIRNPDDPSSVLLEIFDENVRVYLTNKNRINRRIIQSALSESNSEFWYLNNGITMTCESMEYPPGMRAPLLRMRNVQIVNGGQTSNDLFEAASTNPEKFRNVLVLIRVYETRQREMSLKIAESTNSQTPIRSRDLRSNDEIQRKLEESFLNLGYFYERKANQYKDEDKSRRLDALSAGQTYVAYMLEMPSVAGKDRGKIFGDMYETIFNEELTAEALLTPLQIFRPIEAKKRSLEAAIRRGAEYDSSLLFLIDGAYHLLYAVELLCTLQGLDKSDVDVALTQLDNAIAVVQAAVREEEKDPAFALKRFFKSTRAQRNIQRAAKQLADTVDGGARPHTL